MFSFYLINNFLRAFNLLRLISIVKIYANS